MNGSLVTEIPYSEVTATLEVLDRSGITREDLKRLRKGSADLHNQIAKLIRGELVISAPVRNWREEDGVIYFTVTSNGKSGKDWIKHFESKKIKVGDYAKQLLKSSDFKPSKKGTVSQIAVIKGEFFSDGDRITSKIREEADRRKMTKPNAEVACLIRDMFTDEEIKAMGLYWIVAMHEPIKDSGGALILLGTLRFDGVSWLDASCDEPGHRWLRENGFAFVAPQVSA